MSSSTHDQCCSRIIWHCLLCSRYGYVRHLPLGKFWQMRGGEFILVKNLKVTKAVQKVALNGGPDIYLLSISSCQNLYFTDIHVL